jgi:hypothetical protein
MVIFHDPSSAVRSSSETVVNNFDELQRRLGFEQREAVSYMRHERSI